MPLDKNKPIELFAQLYEDLKEDAPDIASMRRSLEKQGVDVEATVSDGLRLFADFKKRKRLERARRKLDNLRKAVRSWSGTTQHSLGTMREDVARALAGGGGEVVYQTYHRKLASVDTADLESLSEDAALLEFIARIEADEAE